MTFRPFLTPRRPDLAADAVATAEFPLRFEDIAHDGRMLATALPPAMGWTVWRQLLGKHPAAAAMQSAGVAAILSRLIVAGTDEPIRPDYPAEATGGYQLAHHRRDGTVDKLFLNMWVEVRGMRSRPTSAGTSGPVVAGHVFAEHTFTRPRAPADERRVTRLELPGLPEVPPAVHAFVAPTSAMEVPMGAIALEKSFRPDTVTTVFGSDHTDSNDHVNSLVYPRLFVEAALRRLAELGSERPGLVRDLEIAYRKPCVVGDRVQIHLRAFKVGGRLGAAGFVAAADDPTGRPYCCARLLFG